MSHACSSADLHIEFGHVFVGERERERRQPQLKEGVWTGCLWISSRATRASHGNYKSLLYIGNNHQTVYTARGR